MKNQTGKILRTALLLAGASVSAVLFALAGCSSDDAKPTASTADSGAKADAGQVCCGKPGDVGNDKGVGKYCTKVDDCNNNKEAVICTTIARADNFFCTALCTEGDGGDSCGQGATCRCDKSAGGCGCVPDSCIANVPAGCVVP